MIYSPEYFAHKILIVDCENVKSLSIYDWKWQETVPLHRYIIYPAVFSNIIPENLQK